MSTEFEVKPFVKKTFDKSTGLVKFTLDTGTEDKNRKLLSTELPDDTLNIDIKVIEVDATPMSELARSHTEYEAHITFESLSGQSGKPVLQHTALYRVDQSIVDEFGKDAIEDEIKNGWFNVVSAAVVGQESATTSTAPTNASFVNNVHEQPATATQPQMSLKNLPTSWLLAGSSILTFLVTLLTVFLIQSIVSPANANDTKAKATPTAAASSFSGVESGVETVSADSSLGLPGINGEALVAAQQQTVTDILKDMGIDATHNQQDLSCLVQ